MELFKNNLNDHICQGTTESNPVSEWQTGDNFVAVVPLFT